MCSIWSNLPAEVAVFALNFVIFAPLGTMIQDMSFPAGLMADFCNREDRQWAARRE
jgi:hypothetical protein